jgi:hypothetical protein
MEAILMADDEDWVYVLSPEERVEDVEAVAVAVEETVTVDDDVEDVAVAVEETVDEDVEAVAVAVEEMVDEDVEDVAVAVEEMVDEDVEDVAVAVEETVDEDVEDVAVAVEETVEEDAEAVAVADAVTVTAAIAGEDNPHDASAAEEQEESDEEEEEAKVGAQPAAEELLPNIDEQGGAGGCPRRRLAVSSVPLLRLPRRVRPRYTIWVRLLLLRRDVPVPAGIRDDGGVPGAATCLQRQLLVPVRVPGPRVRAVGPSPPSRPRTPWLLRSRSPDLGISRDLNSVFLE